MSITIDYPVDELQLGVLIDEGWSALTLWVANSPDGVYTNAGVASVPATLSAAADDEDYTFTFEYGAGNDAQWYKVRAYDGSSNYSDINASKPFHGGGGTTLTVLRQKLGEMVNDMMVTTTTSSGSTTSAVAATREAKRRADGYFVGKYLHDTAQGDWSIVSAFTNSTGTFTLDPALPSAVADEAAIEVSTRWTPDEYRDAINWAVAASFPELGRPAVNTGLRTVSNQYVYQVPADILRVSRVEIASQTNLTSTDPAVHGQPWQNFPFRRHKDGLRRFIELKRNPPDGRRLRIIGEAQLSRVYSDSDYVEMVDPQVDLLLYHAAYYLYNKLANTAPSSDVDRYREMAQHFLGLYEAKKGQYSSGRPAIMIWNDHNMLTGYRGSPYEDQWGNDFAS